MSGSPTVAIIADDLTGAADSAVAFADAGWTTTLTLGTLPAAVDGCVALALDTRALDHAAAHAAVHRAVRGAGAVSGSRTQLLVKVDSTGRGSLAGQVSGALAAWRERHPDAIAVLCPSLPELGRTVVDATLRQAGAPAHLGAAGVDPVTPLTRSDLPGLVPGAIPATVPDLAEVPPGTVAIVDAATRDDLDDLARTILALGSRVVAVGSAGLAASLARAAQPGSGRPGTPRRLAADVVLVSSRHAVSLGQAEAAAAAEAAVLVQLDADALTADRVRERIVAALRAHPSTPVIVVAPPVGRDAQDAAAVADVLGRAVADAVVAERLDAVGLVGGDGAASVLRALGTSSATVTHSPSPGVAALHPSDGRAPDLAVWTKSGGFGENDLLTTHLFRPTPSHLEIRA